MNKCIGLIIFLGVGLLGCVPRGEQGAGVNELGATVPVTRAVVEEGAKDVPVVRPSPTNDNEQANEISLTLTPTPIGGNVHCGDLTEGVERFLPGLVGKWKVMEKPGRNDKLKMNNDNMNNGSMNN